MKRSLFITAAVLAAFGCAQIRDLGKREDPYANPFYAKYLNTGSPLDGQITRTLDAIRADPTSAPLHNELGSLLVLKGFPKDAERELERAINLDGRFYQAWYNLGLVRAAAGDEGGARRAFKRTVHLKPGHAMGLFQLGLIEEKLHHTDRAVALFAKAYAINPRLLEVDVNPRILDTKLTHLALLRVYPTDHARKSMQFHGLGISAPPRPQQAPSPEATPQQIIPPVPPATDPSQQQRPPASVAAPIATPVTAPAAIPVTGTPEPTARWTNAPPSPKPPATTTNPPE
jgi:tetratricopeptide (TPR) repeat protein